MVTDDDDWIERLRTASREMRANPGFCYPPGHTWPPGRLRNVGDPCQCGAELMDEGTRRILDLPLCGGH